MDLDTRGMRRQSQTAGVLFEPARLGPAPALLARPAAASGLLPAVLWFHGFDADKETHRPELGALAKAGFLAVGIDAVGHGERRFPDFAERFAGTKDGTDRLFLDLVAEGVAEVPRIVEALRAGGQAEPDRISLGGVSMGGFIVYGALAAALPFPAAVALLGSPEWPRETSPHLHLDPFFPTALLSINAGSDEVVSPAGARALHRALRPLYAAQPDRLRYREIEGSPHMMGAVDWALAIRETVGWFKRFAFGPAP
jgi:hypothetical protein